MKQIIENLMKHTRHPELDSGSRVNPLLSLRDTCLVARVKRQFRILPQSLWLFAKLLQSRLAIRLPQGRGNTLCAKHDKNLSTYRLNVLESDKNPTLSRICKFAFSSLTNSTLSQRERVKYGFTLAEVFSPCWKVNLNFGFTLAEVFSPCRKVKLSFGFTLAEVLITLGIIGIVAALSIVPLVQKYRIKQLEVAFKHSSSMIEQALLKTAQEFGYGSINDLTKICGVPVYKDNRGTVDTEHPNTIYYNNCKNEYQNNIIPEITDSFLSNLKIIKSYSGSGNWCYFSKLVKIDKHSFGSGIKVGNNGYCELYGTFLYYGNTDRGGAYILSDGSMISRIAFLYHGEDDGLTISFDTNGPFKGPNRLGYDIFFYNTGNWNGQSCTAKKDTAVSGRTCYKYALQDKNPDDNTKGYWESLKL